MALRPRLAVDIGGTFTDLALETAERLYTAKVLTTPEAPDRAAIEGTRRVLADARVSPSELTLVIHGTTLATNALIERKGAKMAFLTTDGFRDTLEIATEGRFDVYDVNLDLPAPLVPRRLRLEIVERMSAQGHVLHPLDEVSVHRAIDEILVPERIESVAVGFLHAYANPTHERRVQDILVARVPNVRVSLSSEVSPEMREYERFSTTCANAYVQPLMARYLERFRDSLLELGVTCPLYLMLSGGGLSDLGTAIRLPVRLVESGPAGGAVFATHVARQVGLDRVVSFDMGGTTAKICLIDDYMTQTVRLFEAARVYRFKKGSGLPLRVPVVDLVEVGAGGGSIAWIDDLGRLTVGPESAGADPGPVCYGRGGARPTVTDADLVLGRIDPAGIAGGQVRLDASSASDAIGRAIGARLGLPPALAAFAVNEVVDTTMAGSARIHAIESGKEVASRALLAFGGAAPLHAARVADLLGIDRILVPAAAGVGSCIGFLRAPVAFELVRSSYHRFERFDPSSVNALLEELSATVRALVLAAGEGRPMTERRLAYMRYVGQGSEVAVPLGTAPLGGDSEARIRSAFEAAYVGQYHRTVPGADIEFISFGVTVSAGVGAVAEIVREERDDRPAPDATRHVFLRETAEPVPVYWRERLQPGARLAGPALIVESQTTTVVPAGWEATVERHDHLVLARVARSENRT